MAVVVSFLVDLDRAEEIMGDMEKWLESGEEEEAPRGVVRWLEEFGDGKTVEKLRKEVVGRLVFEADKPSPLPATTTPPSATTTLAVTTTPSTTTTPDATTTPAAATTSDPLRGRHPPAAAMVEQISRAVTAMRDRSDESQRPAFLRLQEVLDEIASAPASTQLRMQGIMSGVSRLFMSRFRHSPRHSSVLVTTAESELRGALRRILREPGAPPPSPRQHTDGVSGTSSGEHAELGGQEEEEVVWGGHGLGFFAASTPPPPPPPPSSLDNWREAEDESEEEFTL
ncbi:hypothetical protein GP486_008101 [Trichoglossum hirsutum]|uniref:Uncharacterized protein n=1 Tax=Trichoglossum hirsutum TaxID=265104 RepID=A0A9P8IIZ4_9PEZI|nr:hypothetical protein GP486_008101 [Trichoglossum hirsutum]